MTAKWSVRCSMRVCPFGSLVFLVLPFVRFVPFVLYYFLAGAAASALRAA
jgi:hypothetical protein